MAGTGKLQGLLCKGAGFRDCVSKRGRLGDFCCGWRDFAVRRRETKSLRLLPAAKPTSLYKGGLGWLASAGSEALPCGGNGRLRGPLVKGAGFRDCASKCGRLGDFCCGWRDFTMRRWEKESLRLLPAAKPTSLYKGGLGWLANAGGKALPCGGGNGRLQGPLVKGAGFRDCASIRGRLGDSLLRVDAVHYCSKASLTAISIASQTPRKF